MQLEFQKNSVQEFELFWAPSAYFSAQWKARLKNRAQEQVLKVSKNYPNE